MVVGCGSGCESIELPAGHVPAAVMHTVLFLISLPFADHPLSLQLSPMIDMDFANAPLHPTTPTFKLAAVSLIVDFTIIPTQFLTACQWERQVCGVQ